MQGSIQWDDLRTILAIARAGSLSGAARRLRVNHATVFRRLARIEARMATQLFERRRDGYAPTPAGEDIAATAQRVEAEVRNVGRRVAGQDLRPSGTVRVTTTDTLLAGLLSPIFADFGRTYPEISLEVAISNQLFDLTRREADIAIRPSLSPPENLIGRKIGTIAQAVYGRFGMTPPQKAGLQTFDWIGPDERLAYRPLEAWMTGHGLDPRCRYRIDTLLGMHAAVCDGHGLAVLPCYLGDDDARLARAGDPIPELATDLWLLTHPDLRRVARIRAFLDFTAQSLSQMQARLLGNA